MSVPSKANIGGTILCLLDKNHTRIFFLALALPVFFSLSFHYAGFAAVSSKTSPKTKIVSDFTKEIAIKYKDNSGKTHIYLVQKPSQKPISKDAPILIYLHGAGGKEEQGMDIKYACKTFGRLRSLMSKKGWIYVCPRDYEFKGLLKDLKSKYGTRAIYISGASAGARAAFYEATKNPNRYSGLIIMCPAVPVNSKNKRLMKKKLSMPVWIVCGDKDKFSVRFSRDYTKRLKAKKNNYHYREIAGGDHGAPVEQINWEKALMFITGENSTTKIK